MYIYTHMYMLHLDGLEVARPLADVPVGRLLDRNPKP